MTTPRIAQAKALAAELRDHGIKATHRATDLGPLLPAVLIGPPIIDWTRGTLNGTPSLSWSLRVVASTNDPDQGWQELDELIEALAELIDLETATPAAFQVSADAPPLPAYTLTVTDFEE